MNLLKKIVWEVWDLLIMPALLVCGGVVGVVVGLVWLATSMLEIYDWWYGNFNPIKYGWAYMPLWLAFLYLVIAVFLAIRWSKDVS